MGAGVRKGYLVILELTRLRVFFLPSSDRFQRAGFSKDKGASRLTQCDVGHLGEICKNKDQMKNLWDLRRGAFEWWRSNHEEF